MRLSHRRQRGISRPALAGSRRWQLLPVRRTELTHCCDRHRSDAPNLQVQEWVWLEAEPEEPRRGGEGPGNLGCFRKHFFIARVVKPWNGLPGGPHAGQCPSIKDNALNNTL